MYVFAVDHFLCEDCAIHRGAEYDRASETWIVAPDLSGLYDEQRQHA
jgi:hypothetical protein